MDKAGGFKMSKTELENVELKAEVKRLKSQVETLQKQLQTVHPNVPVLMAEPTNGPQAIPPHPVLSMEYILGEIFKHLDFASLKSARLVCTKWAETSTRPFQAKAQMIRRHKDFSKDGSVGYMDFVNRIVADFENIFPPSVPEHKRLKALKWQVPSGFHNLILRPWFSSYGKSLERLELGKNWVFDCEYEDFLEVPKLELINAFSLEITLLDICPNLKELILPLPFLNLHEDSAHPWATPRRVQLDLLRLGSSLEDDPCLFWEIVNRGDGTEFSQTLLFVLDCLSGLKTLEIRNEIRVDLDYFFEELKAYPAAKRVFEGVQILDFSELDTTASLLKYMCKVEFRNMRVLKMGWLPHSTVPEWTCDFLRLLDQLSPTLEELVLKEYCGNYTPLAVPDLPKLKVFRNPDTSTWGVEGVDYACRMPCLEVLELWGDNEKRQSLGDFLRLTAQSAYGPHLALKEFQFTCITKTAEEFGVIPECFPNLERIDGTVSGNVGSLKEALSVFAGLLKLKVLTIRLHRKFEIGTEELETAIVSTIPNFPALKRLHLRGGSVTPDLTGKMFTSGFLKNPTLRKLELDYIKSASTAPSVKFDFAAGLDIVLSVYNNAGKELFKKLAKKQALSVKHPVSYKRYHRGIELISLDTMAKKYVQHKEKLLKIQYYCSYYNAIAAYALSPMYEYCLSEEGASGFWNALGGSAEK